MQMRPAAEDTGVSPRFSLNSTCLSNRFLDLILTGSGLYKEIKTTVCSIYPKVSTLTVDYTDNTQLFNSSFPNFINGTDSAGVVDAPWLGDFVISVFLKGLTVGQSPTGNAMGNTILAFVRALPNGTDVLSEVLVSYLNISIYCRIGIVMLSNARSSLSM